MIMSCNDNLQNNPRRAVCCVVILSLPVVIWQDHLFFYMKSDSILAVQIMVIQNNIIYIPTNVYVYVFLYVYIYSYLLFSNYLCIETKCAYKTSFCFDRISTKCRYYSGTHPKYKYSAQLSLLPICYLPKNRNSTFQVNQQQPTKVIYLMPLETFKQCGWYVVCV